MKPSILLCLLLFVNTARADKLEVVAEGGGKAGLVQPFGVDFCADGSMYIVEMEKGQKLLSFSAGGGIVTLAGTGEKGPAVASVAGRDAKFNGMHHLAVGPDGFVYLADTFNSCIRRYDPKTKLVTLFAGMGEKGYSGDGGPASLARFGNCYCLSFGPGGKELFIADLDNRRIRKIDMARGIVNTVAGNGQRGIPKDGEDAMTQPQLDPRAVAVDAIGNVYIMDRNGSSLRVVDEKRKIRTVAGTGKGGMNGVGGKALETQMKGPKHLCIDRDGSVLIADTENHRIVRYVPGKELLLTVAGTGKPGKAGTGGDPLKAELNQPHGVNVHPKTGEIYIADSSNDRVVRITR